MQSESPGFSVWTLNPDPEWAEKSAGIMDMRLAEGLTLESAESLAERLRSRYGDDTLTVRNHHRHESTYAEHEGYEKPGTSKARVTHLEA